MLIFVVMVFIVGIRAVTSRSAPPNSYLSSATPYVIAHQGGDGLRPGNTLAAFRHAQSLGADVLEMDLHATRDGVLILMHDETVDRTTDGKGAANELINEMDLAELENLDAGYRWTLAGDSATPYRGKGIRVPTLDEVLSAFPNSRFNIEIKQFEPDITEDLCQILKNHESEQRTLIAADDAETILSFRQHCPGVATSAFGREIAYFMFFHKIGLVRLFDAQANALQVPLEWHGIDLVSSDIIHDASRRGMWVDAWTINDTENMRRLIAMGIGGLITDYPDRALKILGRDPTHEEN